jgi:hypothetical protein
MMDSMVEAKYILSLCDRFEPYLMPLDLYVLRQRYNGRTFKSTYTVAAQMGLSDETVRRIEQRALGLIAYCLNLEEDGIEITPMRLAKSFRQPTASLICEDLCQTVTVAAYTAHRGELLIFASSLGRPRDCTRYAYGAIVGRGLVVDCYRTSLTHAHRHQWRLVLAQREAFPEPIPYRGQPSFFYITREVAMRLPPRYEYRMEGDLWHKALACCSPD